MQASYSSNVSGKDFSLSNVSLQCIMILVAQATLSRISKAVSVTTFHSFLVPSFLFHILMWTVQEKLHSETNFKTRDWVFVFLPHEP